MNKSISKSDSSSFKDKRTNATEITEIEELIAMKRNTEGLIPQEERQRGHIDPILQKIKSKALCLFHNVC